MKRLIGILLVVIALQALIACTTQQAAGVTAAAGDGLHAVAPLLPPPFGWLAAGAATLLSGVGSTLAQKAKATGTTDGGALGGIGALTTHNYAITAIAGIVTALAASGIVHIPPDIVTALAGVAMASETSELFGKKTAATTPAAPTP